MNMSGMDPAEVEQLAKEVLTLSRRMQKSESELQRAISNAPWQGNNADRFKYSDWPQYRRWLRSAEDALADAHTQLLRDVADQRRVSNAAFSPSIGALIPGIRGDIRLEIHRLITEGEKRYDWLGDIGIALGAVEKFKRHASWMGPASDVLDQIGIILVGARWASALSSGQWDWGDAFEDVGEISGSVLKKGKFNPVGYLAGTAVAVWSSNINEAARLDWSAEGWRQITSLSRSEWADVIGENLRSLDNWRKIYRFLMP